MRIYLYDTKGKPVSILYEYFDSSLVPIKGDIITIRETSFIVVKRELCCSDLQLNIVRVYVSLIEENGNNI